MLLWAAALLFWSALLAVAIPFPQAFLYALILAVFLAATLLRFCLASAPIATPPKRDAPNIPAACLFLLLWPFFVDDFERLYFLFDLSLVHSCTNSVSTFGVFLSFALESHICALVALLAHPGFLFGWYIKDFFLYSLRL